MANLQEIPLHRDPDIEFWVTLDHDDTICCDGEPVARIVDSKVIKKRDRSHHVRVCHCGQRAVCICTACLPPAAAERLLDLCGYAGKGFRFGIGRNGPNTVSRGSVGAFTNDAAWICANVTACCPTTSPCFTPSCGTGQLVLTVSHGYDFGGRLVFSTVCCTFCDCISWAKLACGDQGNNASSSAVDVWIGTGWQSGSGTVTVNVCSGCGLRLEAQINSVAGIDEACPKSECAGSSTVDACGNMSICLTGVAACNRSYGAVRSRADDNGITCGACETEIAETATCAGGNRGRLQTQYGSCTGKDATVNWGGICNEGQGLAIEFAAAACCPPAVPEPSSMLTTMGVGD